MVAAPATHLGGGCKPFAAQRRMGQMVIHNGEYSHHDWAISVGIFEELLDECAVADLSRSRPYCRMSIFWKES